MLDQEGQHPRYWVVDKHVAPIISESQHGSVLYIGNVASLGPCHATTQQDGAHMEKGYDRCGCGLPRSGVI